MQMQYAIEIGSNCNIKLRAFHTRYQALGQSWSRCTGSQSASDYSICHPPGSRLPLLSARPAFTFPAAEHHRPLAGTKLYCLVTEASMCEQLAEGCYAAFARSRNCTHDLFIAKFNAPPVVPPCHLWGSV